MPSFQAKVHWPFMVILKKRALNKQRGVQQEKNMVHLNNNRRLQKVKNVV